MHAHNVDYDKLDGGCHEPCEDCGFGHERGRLVRCASSAEYPCPSCMWAYDPPEEGEKTEPAICGWPLNEWDRCTRPADHEGDCA